MARGGARILSRSLALAAGAQGCPFQRGEPGDEGSRMVRGRAGPGRGGHPGGAGDSPLAQVPARDFWRQRDLGLRLGSCYKVTVSEGCKEMEKGLG